MAGESNVDLCDNETKTRSLGYESVMSVLDRQRQLRLSQATLHMIDNEFGKLYSFPISPQHSVSRLGGFEILPELRAGLKQLIAVAARRDFGGEFEHVGHGRFAGGDVEHEQSGGGFQMLLVEPASDIFAVLQEIAQMAFAVEL